MITLFIQLLDCLFLWNFSKWHSYWLCFVIILWRKFWLMVYSFKEFGLKIKFALLFCNSNMEITGNILDFSLVSSTFRETANFFCIFHLQKLDRIYRSFPSILVSDMLLLPGWENYACIIYFIKTYNLFQLFHIYFLSQSLQNYAWCEKYVKLNT